MINSYLLELNKRISEFIRYGNNRKIKTSIALFKKKVIRSKAYQPVVFLSTGRTGTKFFSKLLEVDKRNYVLHASKTGLIEQGKIAYKSYKTHGFENEEINRLNAQIYLAAREVIHFECYLHEKKFIEVNNRITFLAPGIKHWMPGTRFVFLYRHPGDFIRSGIRRNWYKDAPHDIGRLVPLRSSSHYNKWNEFHKIQKIAWLWNETNSFIEDFLATLPKTDYLRFNFNQLNVPTTKDLLAFLGSKVDERSIERAIAKPINVQKIGDYPVYQHWSSKEKDWVKLLCGELAKQYGYDLD